MNRGELWTSAGGGDYASKPRPVLILQDDRFSTLDSVTVCPFTSDVDDLSFRVEVEATAANGLETTSHVMADKVFTVRKTRLGRRVGTLTPAEMKAVEEALLLFLGFAAAATD